MERLVVTLKTITPLFLGGAEPDKWAELRAPSIKGAMRFWYRAIDADCNERVELEKHDSPIWEDKIFGSTKTGRGCFAMRLENDSIKGGKEWNHDDYPNKNGIRYLSFSMCMGGKRRRYIPPNTNIGIIIIFHHQPNNKEKYSLLASLWLLGHIGGLGSRSRRGIGTVALQSWGNCRWDECNRLKIAHGVKTRDEWWKIFNDGLNVLKAWFPKPNTVDHSVIDGNTKFFLFGDGKKEWQKALDEAGIVFQKFRQRWNLRDTSSDYYRVMEHLASHESASIKTGSKITLCKISDSPERVAFGLPLSFRYNNSLNKIPKKDKSGKPIIDRNTGKPKMEAPNTTFEGEEHDRSASPIHIRIVQIEENFYPFYIRLDAPLLENSEQIKDSYGTGYSKPTGKILDTFWNELKKNNGKEKTWK